MSGKDIFEGLVKDLYDYNTDKNFIPITQQEFDQFLKESIFEKLKGRSLGELFAEKFKVHDKMLYIYKNDSDALTHIKYNKYVK